MATATKTKSRAAGDSPYYSFDLRGGRGSIELPSVTHIIKSVLNNGMGGMAWWGAKLALRYTLGEENIEHLDALYNAYKESDLNPNAQRDKGGTRGRGAHALLQHLVDNKLVLDGYDPSQLDLRIDGEPVEWNGYFDAVVAWYASNEWAREAESEVELWSLKHGFAGTTDLIYVTGPTALVVDLKTHKPPIRFEDMLQVAGYSLALEEMRDVMVVENIVVLAREDGEYEECRKAVDPDVFVQVKQVYDQMQRWGDGE